MQNVCKLEIHSIQFELVITYVSQIELAFRAVRNEQDAFPVYMKLEAEEEIIMCLYIK